MRITFSMRFQILFGVITALFLVSIQINASGSSVSPRPNIILILADDLGYGDCSITNPESKIKTPHIKQLAKEGLSFSDAHSAASTCTPSRYGLLTGINPVRTGVLNTLLSAGRAIISKDEKTIAHLLKDQGYATHMIGKWHLGHTRGHLPTDHGFKEWYGVPFSNDMGCTHKPLGAMKKGSPSTEAIIKIVLRPEA